VKLYLLCKEYPHFTLPTRIAAVSKLRMARLFELR
jgi:hypothetical protein